MSSVMRCIKKKYHFTSDVAYFTLVQKAGWGCSHCAEWIVAVIPSECVFPLVRSVCEEQRLFWLSDNDERANKLTRASQTSSNCSAARHSSLLRKALSTSEVRALWVIFNNAVWTYAFFMFFLYSCSMWALFLFLPHFFLTKAASCFLVFL